jgi:hypothetical protein
MMDVKFSISIPQRDATGFDDAGVRSYLGRAEELGFDGGWVMEQIIPEAPLLPPMELLASAAACTTRLRLGVAGADYLVARSVAVGFDGDRDRPAQPRPARPRCGTGRAL